MKLQLLLFENGFLLKLKISSTAAGSVKVHESPITASKYSKGKIHPDDSPIDFSINDYGTSLDLENGNLKLEI